MAASTFTSSDGLLGGSSTDVLQAALSAYLQEAYTNAKKLSGTGIVGSNGQIDTSTETYVGQMRWDKPLNPAINIASLTDNTDGTTTSYDTNYLKYIKTVRTHGAERVNMKQIVTQRDGLARIAKDFGETRAQDEHNSLLSILKGVALTEVMNGADDQAGGAGLGGQTFANDPTDAKYGFYVDLGAEKLVKDHAAAMEGAIRAENFLNAMGMAWKDYEPDYAYLVTSPAVMASLRTANLVDQDGVQEGGIMFNTIFGGKFRLIQTRANQNLDLTQYRTTGGSSAGVRLSDSSTTTSFIVLPNAIHMAGLAVPEPVEIDRAASKYQGGGVTQLWYRWGNVYAPAGYDWAGPENAFPSDNDYQSGVQGGSNTLPGSLTDVGITAATGIWQRKTSSALSLGILPIFHA